MWAEVRLCSIVPLWVRWKNISEGRSFPCHLHIAIRRGEGCSRDWLHRDVLQDAFWAEKVHMSCFWTGKAQCWNQLQQERRSYLQAVNKKGKAQMWSLWAVPIRTMHNDWAKNTICQNKRASDAIVKRPLNGYVPNIGQNSKLKSFEAIYSNGLAWCGQKCSSC